MINLKRFMYFVAFVLLSTFFLPTTRAEEDGKKKIILIAGAPSHGPGEHEFRAGCLLLKKCLDGLNNVVSVVYSNGWPQDSKAFEHADAVFLYMDGGEGHQAIQGDHLEILGNLAEKGIGIGCAHFAVEVPKEKGGREFLDWIGGYFETYYSVNPRWEPEFKSIPRHPVMNGVKPFKLRDEWYFHIRFRKSMDRITPLLITVPPEQTRGKPGENSERGGNPQAQAAAHRPEYMAWTYVRTNQGRGFGFTGGHFHQNWGNDDFRKIVLNALLWIAKAEVPRNGVQSTLTEGELKENLDPKVDK